MIRRRLCRVLENERGASMMVVLLSFLTLLGVMALSVDAGILFNSKGEAQRAADAAALAGASAFMDVAGTAQRGAEAERRAFIWAEANFMQHIGIASSEVDTELLDTNTKIRVTVRREAVPTIFTRFVGLPTEFPVAAMAEAIAAPTGTGKCLKPFAIPDPGFDFDGDDDWGTKHLVWAKQDSTMRLIGAAEGPAGGGNLSPIISSPDCKGGALMSVLDELPYDVPGEKVGQVVNGMNTMINADKNLTYDESTKQFKRNGEVVDDWRSSPRVANVALYNPAFANIGRKLQVSDFVTIFFEEIIVDKGERYVWGRVFPSLGISDNCEVFNSCGNSVVTLRLVK